MVLKDPGPTAGGEPSPFDFTWLVARNVHELNGYLQERCPPGAFPMFQRFVSGEVRNVCCFGVEVPWSPSTSTETSAGWAACRFFGR